MPLLNVSEMKLSNGITITIVHDFKQLDGPVNSFQAAFDNWLMRTEDYTAESFVNYVRGKDKEMLIFTKEQYDELLKDLS